MIAQASLDQLLDFVRGHPWIAAVIVIAWAELRILPLFKRDIGLDTAIATKLQITPEEISKATDGITLPLPSVGDVSDVLGKIKPPGV